MSAEHIALSAITGAFQDVGCGYRSGRHRAALTAYWWFFYDATSSTRPFGFEYCAQVLGLGASRVARVRDQVQRFWMTRIGVLPSAEECREAALRERCERDRLCVVDGCAGERHRKRRYCLAHYREAHRVIARTHRRRQVAMADLFEQRQQREVA